MTTLVLVPTELERARLAPHLPTTLAPELCGFGPVAAAARTAQLAAERRPERIALVGIAGTFDAARLPVGAALTFGRTVLDGLGVDGEDGFLGPRELGLAQLDGAVLGEPVYDALELWTPSTQAPAGAPRVLLTAPTASADADQAAARRARHPGVLAEDMEAFGAALAARLFGLPLLVVRGASNPVGQRDPRTWRVDAALAAAADVLLAALDGPGPRSQDGG